MLLYFISYIACLILGISKQFYNKKNSLFIILLGLFLCAGFFCGTDWRSYETYYNEINFNNLFFNYFAEPGFYIYMLPFKYLGVDFWDFAVFTKFICYAAVIKTLYNFLPERPLLAFTYFLPWYGFYLFIDCPMRNMIAVAIVFVAIIRCLIKDKILSYLLLVSVAGTFHFSALLFLFLPIIAKRHVSSSLYCCVFILVFVLFSSSSIITALIDRLFGGIPYIANKIQTYILSESEYAEGRVLSLGMLIQIVFFILMTYKRKVIESKKYGTLIFNMAVMHILLYRVATTIELFSRFQLYTSLFFCIALVILMDAFSNRSKYLYIIYFFCVSSIALTKLFKDERYIPYTSYIPYFIQRDYPSFEYRSAYNFQHSPYK